MIEVVNMKTCCPRFGTYGEDVRIDRASKWGNPFPMLNPSDIERNRVIDAYIVWFEEQEQLGKLNIAELAGAKRLGCWCKPKRCHGDYLKQKIKSLSTDKQVTF